MKYHFVTAPNRRDPIGNEERCDRCGGGGIFFTRVHNGEGIPAQPDEGICYRCNGTGIDPYHTNKNEKENDIMMDATLLKEATEHGFDLTSGNFEEITGFKLVLQAEREQLDANIDHYIDYIDNGRQHKAAKAENDRIYREIAGVDSLIKLVEELETAAINNVITNKEDKIMKDIKTADIATLTKDQIRGRLFDDFNAVISNTLFKKTKREDLIKQYTGLVDAMNTVIDPVVAQDVVVEEKAEESFKVCCGTGRRPKDLFGYEKENYLPMMEKMKAGVKWFYDHKNVRKFISGGAQGWDQLLFWAVNAVKREAVYSNIVNAVYLPMHGQELKWAAEGLFSKKEYLLMVSMADEVKYVTDIDNTANYKQIIDAMMARNHAMVNDSDYVFGCYCDDTWFKKDTKGGTAECLRYAYEKKVDTAIMYYPAMTTKIYNFSTL